MAKIIETSWGWCVPGSDHMPKHKTKICLEQNSVFLSKISKKLSKGSKSSFSPVVWHGITLQGRFRNIGEVKPFLLTFRVVSILWNLWILGGCWLLLPSFKSFSLICVLCTDYGICTVRYLEIWCNLSEFPLLWNKVDIRGYLPTNNDWMLQVCGVLVSSPSTPTLTNDPFLIVILAQTATPSTQPSTAFSTGWSTLSGSGISSISCIGSRIVSTSCVGSGLFSISCIGSLLFST